MYFRLPSLFLLSLFYLLYLPLLSGQVPRDFDVKAFNEKFAVARWLGDYDRTTWEALQSLRKEKGFREKMLSEGFEHFCYQDADGVWHAVLGHFFFTYDTLHPERTGRGTPPSSSELQPYVQALHTATERLKKDHADLPVRMSRYIRKNPDGTFTVWFFPAPFQNDMAIYGGEFSYTLDPSGSRILESSGYYSGKFKGFPLEKGLKEITLDYSDIDEPTLGGIFFVWQYKEFFDKIRLQTARSISTILHDHSGGYYWVHVER